MAIVCIYIEVFFGCSCFNAREEMGECLNNEMVDVNQTSTCDRVMTAGPPCDWKVT